MPKKTIDVQSNGLSHVIGRIAMVCGVVVGLGTLFLVEVQAESFLKRDARFFLERSPDFGEPPPNLQIDGLVHASREDVLRVFEEDLGRSVYLLDLKRRTAFSISPGWPMPPFRATGRTASACASSSAIPSPSSNRPMPPPP